MPNNKKSNGNALPQRTQVKTKRVAKRAAQKSNNSYDVQRRNQVATSTVPVAYTQVKSNYFQIEKGLSKYPGSIRIRSCDVLTSINLSSGAGDQPARLLANILLSPGGSSFLGTRLAQFATLYEKFLFRRFKLIWVPANSTGTSGSIGMSYCRDPTDNTPPQDDTGLRTYMAYMGAKAAAQYYPLEIDCPLADPQDFYYTQVADAESERLTYQGQLYLYSVVASSSNFSGTLFMEYEIDLFDPVSEASTAEVKWSIAGGNMNGVADAGLNPLTAADARNSSKIPLRTDAAGNKYFDAAPGNYLAEMFISQGTGASATATTFRGVANDLAQVVTATVIDSIGAVALGSAYSKTFLKVPIGGAKLYATACAVGIANNMYTRIIPYLGSVFF
jgi:hypothetical protein